MGHHRQRGGPALAAERRSGRCDQWAGAHPGRRGGRAAGPGGGGRPPRSPPPTHPCRLLVVTRSAASGDEHSGPARRRDRGRGPAGPVRSGVMRMQGRLALHAESVVMPLLAAGRAGGDLVARRAAGADQHTTRSAWWPTAGSPTSHRPPTRWRRCASGPMDYAAGRHRPGLDPDHRLAHPAGRQPWSAGTSRPPRVRVACAGRTTPARAAGRLARGPARQSTRSHETGAGRTWRRCS